MNKLPGVQVGMRVWGQGDLHIVDYVDGDSYTIRPATLEEVRAAINELNWNAVRLINDKPTPPPEDYSLKYNADAWQYGLSKPSQKDTK